MSGSGVTRDIPCRIACDTRPRSNGSTLCGGQQRVVRRAGLVEGQWPQLQPLAPVDDVAPGRFGQRQPAEPILDRDLPRRERAEVDLVRRGAARCARHRRQLGVVGRQPEKRAGVDQELHDGSSSTPNARRISSGSGSKKLSGTLIPRSIPTGRSSAGGFGSARISAIGTLRRHSTTVCPCSTLSRYVDSRAFASAMLTFITVSY